MWGGFRQATITSPANNSTLAGSSQQFTWTGISGASEYQLWIGSSSGTANYFYAAGLTGTSITATGLPTNSQAVYARLWTRVGSTWTFNDYTYTAAASVTAVMTSPANGSTLAGASQQFTWTAVSGASEYQLWIGSSTGTANYYYAANMTGTSTTATSLPTSGQAVYARLWTLVNSAWSFNDYAYTAANQTAVMTSPANSSTLTGSSPQFSWTTVPNATQYQLWIGSSLGSANYYAANLTGTTVTASGVPTSGQTLYIRLWTVVGATSTYNDYSYTAANLTAVITSPANGSTLAGSSQQFTWTAISGASDYQLWIGSSPGTANYYYAANMTGTSTTATGLPTSGQTVYARLWTEVGTSWYYSDASFTAISWPTITSISPTSGPPGTQVTITGTGFGAAQGSGNVWLGSTYGTGVSWSDTQVAATVANRSMTGAARILQNGVWSNAIDFTVNVPHPTITAVSPTSGIPGTQVTITGSNFGSQSTGMVIIGTAAGVISSWSDTRIVASVAAGSTTGEVQVAQNGQMSDPVDFIVNVPVVSSVSPVKGTVGTQVTITGSGFGASQGSGSVSIGTQPGIVSSWGDGQIVAIVASGTNSGVASVSQNGVVSEPTPFTVVPLSYQGPTGITVGPALMNMVPGEARVMQALDSTGAPAHGLTWTSSDTSVVSLSTDDPPILTAVGPGHATITAGDSSADVTVPSVSALADGTVKWKWLDDGSGIWSVIPAIPAATGAADIFVTMYSGAIHALTSDGALLWKSTDAANYRYFVPDFRGGLVGENASSLAVMDGLTGQIRPIYTFSDQSGFSGQFALHPDGTIFVEDGDRVLAIDPVNGVKGSVQLEHATWDSTTGRQMDQPPRWGYPIVAGDGYAYVPYAYATYTSTYQASVSVGAHSDMYAKVLRMSSSGAAQTFVIDHWTQDYTMTVAAGPIVANGTWYCDAACAAASINLHPDCGVDASCQGNAGNALQCLTSGGCQSYTNISTQSGYVPFNSGSPWWWYPNSILDQGGANVGAMTNTDQGVLLTYLVRIPQYRAYRNWRDTSQDSYVAAHTESDFGSLSTGGAVAVNRTAGVSQLSPLIQLDDGTYVGTTYANGSSSMLRFDVTGRIFWSKTGYLSPQLATADGNFIASSSGSPQYGRTAGLVFDRYGNFIRSITEFPIQSWTGNMYRLGSTDELSNSPFDLLASFAAWPGGNPSNGTAGKPGWYPELVGICDANNNPHSVLCKNKVWNGYKALSIGKSWLAPPQAAILVANAVVIQRNVLDHLTDANGQRASVAGLLGYLLRGFHPFDGRYSIAPKKLIACSAVSGFVEDEFVTAGGQIKWDAADAATQLLAPSFTTFFNATSSFLTNSQDGTDVDILAMILHEALHGYTHKCDPDLQSALGCPITPGASINITDYLQQFVAVPPYSNPAGCQ